MGTTMKKNIILNIIIIGLLYFTILIKNIYSSDLDFYFKVSRDVGGEVKVVSDSSEVVAWSNSQHQRVTAIKNVNHGFTLSFEIPSIINTKYFCAGLGCSYVLPRSVKGQIGKFSYIPLYASAKFQLPMKNITPYITLHFGYDIGFSCDGRFWRANKVESTETSGYYGLGMGTLIDKFLLEILYTYNKGEYKSRRGTTDSDTQLMYTKISLSLGYRFGLSF